MKFLSLILAIFSFTFIGCDKDKFTTVPQLKLKSISPSTLRAGDVLRVKGTYTDEQGDVDSILLVYKWYNGLLPVRALDTQRYSLKSFNVPAKTREAEINIVFEYQTNNLNLPILSGVSRDTTATFGMVIKDKEGNRSDYQESEKIRIIKP